MYEIITWCRTWSGSGNNTKKEALKKESLAVRQFFSTIKAFKEVAISSHKK